MELRDYGKALRRYWTTWVSLTVAGLLCALTVVLVASPSYQAKAQVFVASTGDGTNSSQFISTRVKSYPDVAVSRTVLAPVIDELGLTESFAALRARVSSINPPDTSQIEIVVTDGDPQRAAAVANAIANRFGTEVEHLEQPATGGSPVALTVTDPATVPATPTFPQPTLLLLLGGVVGMALGVSAAVIRSRVDTRVYDEAGFRAGWGDDDRTAVVLSTRPRRWSRRRPHGPLLGRPATMLVRRLAALAPERTVRVVVTSLPVDDDRASEALAREVAAGLKAEDIRVAVIQEPSAPAADTGARPGVELQVSSPAAPLWQWRRLAASHDGVVLVVEPGRVHRAELAEVRSILSAAGLPLIAVVLKRRARGADRPAAGATSTPVSGPVERIPVPPSARTAPAAPAGRR